MRKYCLVVVLIIAFASSIYAKNSKKDISGVLEGYYKIDWDIKYIYPYKNGVAHGLYKEYAYKNGIYVIRQIIPYKNGKKEGLGKIYDVSNEFLEKTITYKNDKKEGITKIYDRNGELHETQMYKNNILQNSTRKYYRDDGTLHYEIKRILKENMEENIIETSYYKSGKLKKEIPLDNDEDLGTGIIKQYYESGALQFEIAVISGRLGSSAKQYYENGKIKVAYKQCCEEATIYKYNKDGSKQIDFICKDSDIEDKISKYEGGVVIQVSGEEFKKKIQILYDWLDGLESVMKPNAK